MLRCADVQIADYWVAILILPSSQAGAESTDADPTRTDIFTALLVCDDTLKYP